MGIDEDTELFANFRRHYAYYLDYGPKKTLVQELIRIAGSRWQIEDCFEAAKEEVGLDEYEVRKWDGWHRDVTPCMLAHAYLAVVRSVAAHKERVAKGGSRARRSLPQADLTDTEVMRVILAMTKPKEEWEFRLGWSLWRRAHQAVAKRCHEVSHAAKHGPLPEERLPDLAPPTPTTRPFSTPMAACLTDEKWKLVKLLMPPQKPPTGRPRSDHHTMLAGVLWIFGTSAAWQDFPEEEFGPWRTVYGHYRQWQEEGLWQQIVQMFQL